MSTFRRLRILALLIILLLVAAGTWLARLRSTDWDQPLVVAIYPVNADRSQAAADYIDTLTRADFLPIESFFAQEAEQYDLPLGSPVEVVLAPELEEMPPAPPADRNVPGVMAWSLKMRYWAWRIARNGGPVADVQLFVLYHDPAANPRLAHSLGLQKGLLGVVHAYAADDYAGGNLVVIAHEFLHTLGATDKYDPATNLPLFPVGYAEPEQEPLLPQALAEIMAGRIPHDARTADQARGLDETVVGEYTAREIRWIE